MSRSFKLRLVLFALAMCLLHCAGNGTLPLIDRDEPRFAEATREMVQTGDWIVPYFNGGYRFDKPPLSYWLQAAASQVFGLNEFGVRFPSALCAALTAVLIVLWGRRWKDEATGWRAGLIFSLCVQVFLHARASVADMPVVLFFTGAAWCVWLAQFGGRMLRFWFWFFLALGFLAKGPLAWLPILALPFAPAASRRTLLHPWWSPALGAVFMLALVAAWGIPANLATDWDFWMVGFKKHVVDRSTGVMEGHGLKGMWGYFGMMPLYFLTVWLSFFPWSIWLPRTAKAWWREGCREETARYLGALVLVVFIVFTLVSTKLPHYTLPAFPMLALLIASAWPKPKEGADGKLDTFGKVAVAWGVVVLVLPFTLFPWVSSHSAAEEIWAHVSTGLAPETELATTTQFKEASLVWTFRRRLTGYHQVIEKKRAVRWMGTPGPRLLICGQDEFRELFPKPPKDVDVFPLNGLQPAKGQFVSLVALWKKK